MKDATIHMTTYENFTGAYHKVYVVAYEKDSSETRQIAMKVARQFIGAPRGLYREYDLLQWNCETFVIMCKTGQYRVSEQVERFMDAIKEDVLSHESIICNSVMMAVRSSGSSKCMIM